MPNFASVVIPAVSATHVNFSPLAGADGAVPDAVSFATQTILNSANQAQATASSAEHQQQQTSSAVVGNIDGTTSAGHSPSVASPFGPGPAIETAANALGASLHGSNSGPSAMSWSVNLTPATGATHATSVASPFGPGTGASGGAFGPLPDSQQATHAPPSAGAVALDGLVGTISHDLGGIAGAVLGALGNSMGAAASTLADAHVGTINQMATTLSSASAADVVQALSAFGQNPAVQTVLGALHLGDPGSAGTPPTGAGAPPTSNTGPVQQIASTADHTADAAANHVPPVPSPGSIALDGLVNAVSHDLGGPLGSVVGALGHSVGDALGNLAGTHMDTISQMTVSAAPAADAVHAVLGALGQNNAIQTALGALHIGDVGAGTPPTGAGAPPTSDSGPVQQTAGTIDHTTDAASQHVTPVPSPGSIALDGLVNSVSHDLGGPLGSVVGALGHSVGDALGNLAGTHMDTISQMTVSAAPAADAVHAVLGALGQNNAIQTALGALHIGDVGAGTPPTGADAPPTGNTGPVQQTASTADHTADAASQHVPPVPSPGSIALDGLVNSVSHDLGGPLGSVVGALGHSVGDVLGNLAGTHMDAISQMTVSAAPAADAVHAVLGALGQNNAIQTALGALHIGDVGGAGTPPTGAGAPPTGDTSLGSVNSHGTHGPAPIEVPVASHGSLDGQMSQSFWDQAAQASGHNTSGTQAHQPTGMFDSSMAHGDSTGAHSLQGLDAHSLGFSGDLTGLGDHTLDGGQHAGLSPDHGQHSGPSVDAGHDASSTYAHFELPTIHTSEVSMHH